jgi:hypothetical protein
VAEPHVPAPTPTVTPQRVTGGFRGVGAAGAATAGAAIVELIAQFALQRYAQGKLDKINVELFHQDLAAKQPLIDSLIASQQTRIGELQARGVPVYVNLTLEVAYQTGDGSEGASLGGTVFTGLQVKDVKISGTPVERVTTTMASRSLGSIAAEQMLGLSRRLISYSLTYPGLTMASKEAH